MMQWKVLYVGSRREKKVADFLDKWEITYYLPLITKVKQWSDRKKKVSEPLFKSYVFVKASALNRDKILQIPGAVKYLRFNEKDAVVREQEIEAIKTFIEKGFQISADINYSQWVRGEKVKFTQGILKGIEAEISEINGEKYAQIILTETDLKMRIKIENTEIFYE